MNVLMRIFVFSVLSLTPCIASTAGTMRFPSPEHPLVSPDKKPYSYFEERGNAQLTGTTPMIQDKQVSPPLMIDKSLSVQSLYIKADRLFHEDHYKDAATIYRHLLDKGLGDRPSNEAYLGLCLLNDTDKTQWNDGAKFLLSSAKNLDLTRHLLDTLDVDVANLLTITTDAAIQEILSKKEEIPEAWSISD